MFTKHNIIVESMDHYISWNFADHEYYGSDTTAIVIGQMQRFYILNGDHRKALSNKTFLECIAYFSENSQAINCKSDVYSKIDAENIIKEYEKFKKETGE